nr:ARID DNA-binding domain-containing protein [Tanacetum cinerariifolium]
MVNVNRVLSKDWFNQKPVNRNFQYGIKSHRFKPWDKSIREHPEDFGMRYSLANGTAEIVPNSQRKKLSHKGKTMLNEKMKEIEAFNSSLACTAFKRKDAKTRKERRARCFICKERGHVLWKCHNKKNKNRGETSKALAGKRPKYPERVHVKTDYMVEGSDEQNLDKIWYVGNAYKNHMSPTKSSFKRLMGNFKSQRFKPWEKPIRNRLENYKMRYALKNWNAEIVPKSNQKRQLSNEGKNMLKEKLQKHLTPQACAQYSREKVQKESQGKKKGKYPEVVHVKTDYTVEGSDEQTWNKIWYVGSVYKNHMSPTKSLFKRLKNSFKVLDKKEDERKFIFSDGVGEATVETKDGTLVIPNVYYTPEITINVLSIEQLENQGYVMTYDRNRCGIRYMFDNEEGMIDAQQDSVMTCEDLTSMVESHNKFLEEYFESIDPTVECSLIKGMEDLKMEKEDVQDYIDDEYLSMNGTLYAMK